MVMTTEEGWEALKKNHELFEQKVGMSLDEWQNKKLKEIRRNKK